MNLIPETALSQHIAVLGKTGSGKTFAIKGIVEGLLASKKRIGIIDPTGAWWGLRSSRDGKGAGFPILILGGDHGDLPLPALGGAAVAKLLVEQGANLVCDTSHLTVGERTRWFIDFGSTLYRANRAPLHLVIDEAHNFAPQGKVPDPDTGKMLHAANTLASGGRSRGIRLTMITQRPAKLHKDSLTCADTLIAMRVLAPQDRQAVKDWIDGCGDAAQGKEVLDSLANLQRGEGWAWYPEGRFLKRMKFPAIKTFDSSATPTDGHELAQPKAAAEIDMTEIKAALADAVREAEANDPKILRKRIAELERAKPTTAGHTQAELNAEFMRGHVRGCSDTMHGMTQLLRSTQDHLTESAANVNAMLRMTVDAPKETPARAVPMRAPEVNLRPRREPAPADGLSATEQRVLDALAWWASVRVDRPDKGQVGFIAGYRVGKNVGGTFGNILGALRSRGLIDYPAPGLACLTTQGAHLARQPVETPNTLALQRAIYDRLDNTESRVLRGIVEAYPHELTKKDAGQRAGYSVGDNVGGTFGNILGRLRSLGLIDYPSPGHVVALPVLFL